MENVKDVSLAPTYSAALTEDGRFFMWGSSLWGVNLPSKSENSIDIFHEQRIGNESRSAKGKTMRVLLTTITGSDIMETMAVSGFKRCRCGICSG